MATQNGKNSRWRRALRGLFKPAKPSKPAIRPAILKTPFYY